MSEHRDIVSNKVKSLLGKRGFTSDPDLVDPWLTDWRGRYHGAAIGLASPSTTDEVAKIVKICDQYNVPIVPQGGNSGMVGGATPDKSGNSLLLSLRRLNQIRSFNMSANQIICEAGVILQDLQETVNKSGLRFPLTLGGKGSATIGGLVSTNAGGTQVLRHGTMRAQVLGLEAVLANGQIFNGLTALKKDNRGFDLKQLLIGSEGTLGIVTAVNVRVLPEIEDRVVIWASMKSIQQARQLLLFFQKEMSEELEGFEIIPDHCLTSVIDYLPSARSPLSSRSDWNVLIEVVIPRGTQNDLRSKTERTLETAFEDGLLEDAVIASNESQAEDFWLLRDSIAPAEKALGPAVQHDISVAVERMPDFVETAVPNVQRKFPGTKAIAFGHLGDGNVHFHVLAPQNADPGDWEFQEGKDISAYVYEMVADWGGSISAEHGIGQVKRDELERLGDPVALEIMRSVKTALDPKGLLNPGKLI